MNELVYFGFYQMRIDLQIDIPSLRKGNFFFGFYQMRIDCQIDIASLRYANETTHLQKRIGS